MTNSNTIKAPTGQPLHEPKSVMMDLVLAVLLIIVIGLAGGYAYQQNVGVLEAHSTHEVRWTYKEPAALTTNPNCRLYRHDSCPFDPPTPPEGGSQHVTASVTLTHQGAPAAQSTP